MALFKKAIIDEVEWTPQEAEMTYAWRYPERNLSTYTQLIVYESQEAILYIEGQIAGKFGPGKRTLDTKNLPILNKLFGIPFGGKNPFTAEVWFINKLLTYSIDWSTDSMSIHDVDYNTQIPLVAKGRYGLKINNAEKFLIKIVGTKNEFTQDDLTDQSYGEFVSKTKSTLSAFMIQNKIGLKYISAHLDLLSQNLKEMMSTFWDNLGMEFTQFYITSVDVDTSTETGRKVKEAISTQSAMSITGHTWQQEKMFDVANNAIEGFSNQSGGLLGGLMAMNMMGGMGGGGGAGAGMMQPQFNQPSFGGSPQGFQGQGQAAPKMHDVYCSNCSKKYSSNHRFCPHCGDPYNPCPKCGTDNDEKAKRCISCGLSLQGETSVCPNCNIPVAVGASFCGNCGKQLASASSDNCSRCGTAMPPTVKFCPKCGNKR